MIASLRRVIGNYWRGLTRGGYSVAKDGTAYIPPGEEAYKEILPAMRDSSVERIVFCLDMPGKEISTTRSLLQ